MPRDTRTGGVLEQMILPALSRGGYTYKVRVKVGKRLGCGAHYVDVVAKRSNKAFLISLKWQQVAGTAEQKIPFEVICLSEVLTTGEYEKAYVVLGGEGWTLRQLYVGGGLNKHLQGCDNVSIVTLEHFVGKANRSEL
jgi:hypothetical protein